MKNGIWILAIGMLSGCASAHVGMGIPVPGPIKPHVGVSASRLGIKGTGGVSAKVGPVPVSVGGSTKPVKLPAKKRDAD